MGLCGNFAFFFIVSLFVSFCSLIYIFMLMFGTVDVWMVLYKYEHNYAWLRLHACRMPAWSGRSKRFASRGFVWLALLTDISWKRLRRGPSSWTKTELSFPKSAQTIQTMQENNDFSGVNLSLFKTRPDLLKIESGNVHFHANPYISPNAQSKHICIFPKVPRSTDPQSNFFNFLFRNKAII